MRQEVDAAGTVLTTYGEDYYPFGLQMPGRSMVSDAPKERFTGHELDDETGLYYAGARYLDPVIGRWMSVGPMADKMPGWAPYNYAFNNPVRFTDPDGQMPCCLPRLITPMEIKKSLEVMGAAIVSFFNATASGDVGVGSAIDDSRQVTIDQELNQALGETFGDAAPAVEIGVAAGALLGGKNPRKLGNLADKASDLATSFGKKIEKQMGKRGWSQDDVLSTISNPFKTKQVRDTRHRPDGSRTDAPATAYIREDGSYVIRNDRTGDVVQVSKRNDPNWRAPWDEDKEQ